MVNNDLLSISVGYLERVEFWEKKFDDSKNIIQQQNKAWPW